MAVRELGAARDLRDRRRGSEFCLQLGKVLGAQIPNSAKELILGGNLRRLLTVLPAQGYRI
jgi:hypothetical protein